MKIKLTLEDLEEIALCIVINQMSEEEACAYIKEVAFEIHNNRIDAVLIN